MAQPRIHGLWLNPNQTPKYNYKRRLTEPTKSSKKHAPQSKGSCKRRRIESKTRQRRRTIHMQVPLRTYYSERPQVTEFSVAQKGSESPQQPPETSHNEIKDNKGINALFPGSYVEEIKCGSHGGVYNSHEHGIVLVIPEGAIAEEKEITIEIGVTLNGPFTFPQGMHPVSPILWLCVKEETFSGFSIPVSIKIPHFIKCTTQESCNRLTFLKAAHRHSLEGGEMSSETQYQFDPVQEMAGPTSFHPLQSFGTFETKHFCSLCIAAKLDESIKSDVQHCLLGAVCRKGHEMWIRFAVLYMLDTCVQSTKQVFDNLFGKDAYRLISPRVFRFLSGDSNKTHLKISFERSLRFGWLCALESSDEIEQNDVDFWQLSAEQLTTMQKNGAYPPSFAICATGGSENDLLTITFSGSMHDNKLITEIPLSLADLDATQKEPTCTRNSISATLTDIITAAEIDLITTVVLQRLQWNWEKVPNALTIPEDVIFETKHDVKGVRNQISALLKYWRDSSKDHSKEQLVATLSKADERLQCCIAEVLNIPISQLDCNMNSAEAEFVVSRPLPALH